MQIIFFRRSFRWLVLLVGRSLISWVIENVFKYLIFFLGIVNFQLSLVIQIPRGVMFVGSLFINFSSQSFKLFFRDLMMLKARGTLDVAGLFGACSLLIRWKVVMRR